MENLPQAWYQDYTHCNRFLALMFKNIGAARLFIDICLQVGRSFLNSLLGLNWVASWEHLCNIDTVIHILNFETGSVFQNITCYMKIGLAQFLVRFILLFLLQCGTNLFQLHSSVNLMTLMELMIPGLTFKCKRYPDGSSRKFEARFYGRGDQQVYSLDYFDTFAWVVSLTTVRILLVLSVILL